VLCSIQALLRYPQFLRDQFAVDRNADGSSPRWRHCSNRYLQLLDQNLSRKNALVESRVDSHPAGWRGCGHGRLERGGAGSGVGSAGDPASAPIRLDPEVYKKRTAVKRFFIWFDVFEKLVP
jgi:hypothetical protein